MTTPDLAHRKCKACEGGVAPLKPQEIETLLKQLKGWECDGDGKVIAKSYAFKNYYQTLAFVNATAWISHREDHHPDIALGYNQCRVAYSTHAIGGLSENDFICAAKLDRLFEL
ncbi:MAG TPA: 4a-hydroxytetrahydrobiopterin dehydratase [Burkholderiales bacterium]|nr:4a-hydroxytetrahydrobiopterin dehydratase [Burkholderiales bacterium]